MLLITTLKVHLVLDWKVGRDIEFRCRFMRGTMTEDSKRNSESDSSLVWSTEDAKNVAVLLSRYNGDLNASLRRYLAVLAVWKRLSAYLRDTHNSSVLRIWSL